MVHRLPDEDHIGQVGRLLRREIGSKEGVRRIRWVRAKTANGTVQALTFWVGPRGWLLGKQPLSRCSTRPRLWAYRFGRAYLFHTVTAEEFGVRDRICGAQQLVADEIPAATRRLR
jgi:cation transport protein ChaC